MGFWHNVREKLHNVIHRNKPIEQPNKQISKPISQPQPNRNIANEQPNVITENKPKVSQNAKKDIDFLLSLQKENPNIEVEIKSNLKFKHPHFNTYGVVELIGEITITSGDYEHLTHILYYGINDEYDYEYFLEQIDLHSSSINNSYLVDIKSGNVKDVNDY